MLIHNTDKVLATVTRLKASKIKLSIDDFGTGYSSLSYLKHFQVDRLNIDQSFIRSLVAKPEDVAIVLAIIQMAHSLNLRTIAEGIEIESARQQLRALGCDEAQGYFFAKPLPPDEFAGYLRSSAAAC